jgi:hypothetical protein
MRRRRRAKLVAIPEHSRLLIQSPPPSSNRLNARPDLFSELPLTFAFIFAIRSTPLRDDDAESPKDSIILSSSLRVAVAGGGRTAQLSSRLDSVIVHL